MVSIEDYLARRPPAVPDALDRVRLVQHEGFIDPNFRKNLVTLDARLRVRWSRVQRKWVFSRVSTKKTGLGEGHFWHDPENWYKADPSGPRKDVMRAAVWEDIERRAHGESPVHAHAPEQGPLDEIVLYELLLGDADDAGAALMGLRDRISSEVNRRVHTTTEVDLDFAKAVTIHPDNPISSLVDPNGRAKRYRDRARREEGLAPLDFRVPAAEPSALVSVPSGG